jgi:hypothetical protein
MIVYDRVAGWDGTQWGCSNRIFSGTCRCQMGWRSGLINQQPRSNKGQPARYADETKSKGQPDDVTKLAWHLSTLPSCLLGDFGLTFTHLQVHPQSRVTRILVQNLQAWAIDHLHSLGTSNWRT